MSSTKDIVSTKNKRMYTSLKIIRFIILKCNFMILPL